VLDQRDGEPPAHRGDVSPSSLVEAERLAAVGQSLVAGGDRGIGSVTHCSFCVNRRTTFPVILKPDQSAICDECVFLVFDTIGGQRGFAP
jgi:hypothetical protein